MLSQPSTYGKYAGFMISVHTLGKNALAKKKKKKKKKARQIVNLRDGAIIGLLTDCQVTVWIFTE